MSYNSPDNVINIKLEIKIKIIIIIIEIGPDYLGLVLREYSPPTMRHMSRVAGHVSRVRCHMSGVMCHFFFYKLVELVEGVCYQRGLPRRLLHPQHLGGIWAGLMPYRMPFDTLIEYPEPWLQQTRGSLS